MSYRIAGAVIKNEYLAIGTIVGTIAIAASQLGGSKEAAAKAPPPIQSDASLQASSSEEEAFIRQFVSEAEEKKH